MKTRNLFTVVILLSCSQLFSQRTVPNSGIYWAPMTINNVVTWYSTDGRQEVSNSTLKITGATFPRNTAPIVSNAGFVYCLNAPQQIVNGSFSYSTLQPGSIVGLQTGLADNRYNPTVRIWRIRKDFATADLRKDASETYGIIEKQIGILDLQRLRLEYKKDWIEWPAAKGAPYYDVNKNGIYDPKFTTNEFNIEIPDTNSDAPGIANADQVIWYVANDLAQGSPWGSPKIGLEIQFTIWGYNTNGALGNTIFRRYKMIYKGTANTSASSLLSNTYVGVLSTVTLGQSNDNLAGSDSLLGLGFVYNAKILDNEYRKFNRIPPAVGYDILQGPIVKGTSIDSALVNFSYKRGYKNLPTTSITYFGPLNRPPFLTGSGASEMVNALKGYPTVDTNLRVDPTTLQKTKFWSTGDPVSKNGWIDGVYEGASSRELILSTGPFSMALGDTQEIVSALIAADSPDRVASVHVLKYYDKIVQDSYQQFVTPAPSLPKMNATLTELNNSFLIEWEKDTARLNQTERFSSRGYLFEGYNLYQLAHPLSAPYTWKKVGTYDLQNEVTQIVQEDINLQTGRVELQVKQEGKNSGIIRYLILENDALRNIPFVNGQQYYFAVTSYAYTNNPSALLRTIESEPQIISAVPHRPNPETILPYAIKDSLENLGENFIGQNDVRIGVKILDPYSVVGGTYDFWFGVSDASSTWTMVKNEPGSNYTTVKARLTANELPLPRPNPLPTGTGIALFTINDALDKITYSVEVNTNTNVTSIEIGQGPKTQNGPVLKTLSINSKTASGVWLKTDTQQPLTDSIIRDLAAGFLYVMVKSTNYPNGELRGQFYDGSIPRVKLPLPDFATSSRSVFTFLENRFVFEGISLYVSPAPTGFKSGEQVAPSRSNVVNQTNKEGTYSLIGPGISWGGYNLTESVIEIRFTNDTNWAMIDARLPAETKFIRVPFQVYQDSVRVWAVIENTIATDSLWNIKGNTFKNGKPTFDKIVGVVNKADAVGNDISYNTLTRNGMLPTTNTVRARLINGLNHIARNIIIVNESDNGIPPAPGTIIRLTPNKSIKYGDIRRITLQPIQKENKISAKQQLNTINVFPNPYYGVNIFESSTTNKFVTFSHLPEKATIRIFNLGGIHVRTMYKDDPSQFFRWDLRNEKGFFVASGLYIVYIDAENIGVTTLKLAVIMEDQNLNIYE